MITVITRLYPDEASARGIVGRLYRAGFPSNAVSMVGGGDGDAERKLSNALIPEDAVGPLAKKIKGGNSAVIVRATYKPLNAVRIATETFETR